MMPAFPRRLPTNPFATRFTRPGVLPALGPQGEPIDAAGLLSRISPGRVVTLVGPHGHGKSTLLSCLTAAARHAGSETTAVRIRSPSDSWRPVAAVLATPRGGLVTCDGWERSLPGTGVVVRAVAAARGLRVVVTTHQPRGLPVLAYCDTSAALLDELVARLPDHGGLIDATDIDDAYHRHAGNVREALYDLYDRFERRARDHHREAEAPAIEILTPR